MSYKLAHRTIGFGFDPRTRQPSQGIAGVFFIPSYQRGYRWTSDEVTKLLDDIWESQGAPYSLQPIVVRSLGVDNWELVDGQQRLTTLWLILRFMQKGEIRYSLQYQTRPGSQTYLTQIDAEQSTHNIDYFHLHQANTTIMTWFMNKMGAPCQQFLIDEIFRFLSTSVRIIWYEVPETEKTIPLFTRLNQGRIPLTDAELIKAVLLTQIEQEKKGRESEVAAQWDGIERDLQRDEIWSFVAHQNAQKAHQSGTRIDLLLDALARKPITGASQYHTFDVLQSKALKSSLAFWDEVVALHAQLLGWFEEPRWYNKIGFLVACGTSISAILCLAQGKKDNGDKDEPPTKSAFEAILNAHIRCLLTVSFNDDLDALRYKDASGYRKLQQVLLLFNVAICQQRFPFEKHVGETWSLEHIHAQNAQELNRTEHWDTWLQEHRKALFAIHSENNTVVVNNLIIRIDAATAQLRSRQFGQEQFKELAGHVMLALNDGVVEETDHSIANLALLSQDANAALSNAVFEVKRHKVLEMDKRGKYIPAATRNVFLKYYSPAESLQSHFWSGADKIAYRQTIKDVLTAYLR